MIYRYRFGQPIRTFATVVETPISAETPRRVAVSREDGGVRMRFSVAPDVILYGLGESVGGIDKRGQRLRAWNSDETSHTEDKASLYGSHNFLLVVGEEDCFGLFLDDPGAVNYDLCFTRTDEVVIFSENGDFDLYEIEGETPGEICRRLRELTGRSYLPPRWAFGYIQSRWGYATETEIREVVERHREKGIPLDSVSLDIDYMDRYRDFTWDRSHFPDLKALSGSLRRDHLHLVPIIDAGIPLAEDDESYVEGLKRDCFCRKEDGEVFVGAVWPGRSVFPDFLREDVRTWFASRYRPLLEAGIEGFWNDMNEPAIFYSDEGLAEAYEKADALRGRNLGIDDTWQLQAAFNGVSNSMDDYRRFYHQAEGRRIRHDKAHNLYGAMMTASTADALKTYAPGKRCLLFSRASMIGAHRDGGVWQGDNSSWWSHLLMNLKMLPGLNMCGFLYTGADLGGFSRDTTPELLLRWLELGVFTPLMRNHSAHHTRMQEIYRFDNWEKMRDVVNVRYILLPWLYSEFMIAALSDGLLFRPLGFDYPEDPIARRVEDQLMLGRGAMIAPVCAANVRGRMVYLPEDMLLVRFSGGKLESITPCAAGAQWVDAAPGQVNLFLRRNTLLPLAEPAQRSELIDDRNLTLVGWLNGDVTTTIYRDDGVSAEPALEAGLTEIRLRDGVAEAEGLTLRVHCVWD